jgi:hypothetical protein
MIKNILKQHWGKIVNVIALVSVFVIIVNYPAIAQNVKCYLLQGGNKAVAASGCEYEFLSGSILDVQAGATVTFAGGMTNSSNMVINAPTAVGTSTPALLINNDGVSNPLEVRDSSTPVFTIVDGGNVTASGLVTLNGGSVNNVNAVVAGPTALATATPVFYVNSASAHNLVVVSKNATPVFTVGNAGAVTGQVVSYGSAIKESCGTQSVTGSATTTPHGLSTPTFVNANLAADPIGDQIVSYTNSAAVVTLKVWKSTAGTPTASGDAVNVTWCIKGTP